MQEDQVIKAIPIYNDIQTVKKSLQRLELHIGSMNRVYILTETKEHGVLDDEFGSIDESTARIIVDALKADRNRKLTRLNESLHKL